MQVIYTHVGKQANVYQGNQATVLGVDTYPIYST